MKTSLVGKLAGPPNGVNDRLMTLKLTLSFGRHLTITSTYAPTMTNLDEVKFKFYEELHSAIAAAPKADKLIILGEFNARVSSDNVSWDGVIGEYGVGHCNSNGFLLLQTCAEHELLITNKVFRLPTRNRMSWMHPRSKHWHLINYVVIRKRDRQDVRVTKSMCGADCWTDHRLIVTNLNMRVQSKRRPQGKKAPKRLNITQLKNINTKQCFVDILEVRLESTPLDSQNVEADWATHRELVYNTATEILGPSTRKHKDWFDENCDEIKQLLDEKQRINQAYLSSPMSTSKKVQQKLRQMQNTWLRNKADVIQSYADRHDLKNFYDALKDVYGPTSSGSSPLLSADVNTLFTNKEKIPVRWAEHFNSVLNCPSSINNEAINRLPQGPIIEALDDPPTLLETQKSIRLLSSGKAPGSEITYLIYPPTRN